MCGNRRGRMMWQYISFENTYPPKSQHIAIANAQYAYRTTECQKQVDIHREGTFTGKRLRQSVFRWSSSGVAPTKKQRNVRLTDGKSKTTTKLNSLQLKRIVH